MEATSSANNVREIIFEHKWVIKNWRDVVHINALTENTKTEIKLETKNFLYAKVMTGTSLDGTEVGFYWKLCKHPCMGNVQFDLVMEVFSSRGIVAETFMSRANAVTKTNMEIKKSFWSRYNTDDVHAAYVNSEGSLVLRLEFNLTNLPDVLYLSNIDMEQFKSSAKTEFYQNIAGLLDDESSSDVTIVTKDRSNLYAHKLILRAQCPVFATMFGSTFLESSTGVVKVDDVSAKTMKILLNYWYTGELQTSWKDDDIVVEFVYAAGKYQMTRVLQVLDYMLGRDFETSEVEVDLLRMAQQLYLKNAEARLTKRIIYRIGQAESGTELLSLFSLTTDNLDEKNFGASKRFKACENDSTYASNADVKLLALACKFRKKNTENRLLKRIIGTVVKMETADELFALFDDPKIDEPERRD